MNARFPHRGTIPPARYSRAWVFEHLRTLLWVAVITALIWIYADLQHTVQRDLSATLRISTEWSGQGVVLEMPLDFRVKGNSYAIDRLSRALDALGSVLLFSPSKPVEPDGRLDSTAEIIAGLPLLHRAGLEITSVQPPGIKINDCWRVLAGIPVRFDSTGGELESPAVLDPPLVQVRIPVGQLGRLEPAKLTLSTAALDIRDAVPGEPTSRDVEVLPPPGIAGAKVTPPKVRAAFTVLQATELRKLTVTVSVQSPRAWTENDTWSQYRLEVKDALEWTKQFTVQGSRSDLAKLRPEDVQAFIILTEDDKRPLGSWLPREVKVRFPPDLKVSLGPEKIPDVSFKLVKRAEATPP